MADKYEEMARQMRADGVSEKMIARFVAEEMEEDEFRRATMEVRQKAESLLSEVDSALASVGKQIDKAEKKQVKADSAELRRILMKRPGKKERANPEEEGRRIVVAAEQLDRSSAHVRELAGQQQG